MLSRTDPVTCVVAVLFPTVGRIRAIQLDYSEAYRHLVQVLLKLLCDGWPVLTLRAFALVL